MRQRVNALQNLDAENTQRWGTEQEIARVYFLNRMPLLSTPNATIFESFLQQYSYVALLIGRPKKKKKTASTVGGTVDGKPPLLQYPLPTFPLQAGEEAALDIEPHASILRVGVLPAELGEAQAEPHAHGGVPQGRVGRPLPPPPAPPTSPAARAPRSPSDTTNGRWRRPRKRPVIG